MDWQKVVLVLAKTAFIVSSTTVGITAVGVVLNWFFTIVVVVQYYSLAAQSIADVGVAARTPIGTIIAILPIMPFVMAVIIYIFVFPYLYFKNAKSYAITKGLYYLFHENKSYVPHIFGYITFKIAEKFEQAGFKNFNDSSVVHFISGFFEKMEDAPKPIRFLFSHLMKKIPFQETFVAVTQDIELKKDNAETIGNKLAERLTSYVEKELLNPSLTPFWILFIGNIILMVVTLGFLGSFYGN